MSDLRTRSAWCANELTQFVSVTQEHDLPPLARPTSNRTVGDSGRQPTTVADPKSRSKPRPSNTTPWPRNNIVTIRASDHNGPSDHIGPMTIGPPLSDQNHRWITSIRREKREMREERQERTEKREEFVRIKKYFFFTI